MKTWPVIRHIRYVYHLWLFSRYWKHAEKLYVDAVSETLTPHPMDLDYLEGVKKGYW